MPYYGSPSGYMSPIWAATANTTFTVPAGWMVDDILISNSTANAVTGGVKVGTTNGGIDVVIAMTVGANFIGHVPDATILKRIFSTTVDTVLYIQAVTLWNSSSLDFRFVLKRVT